VDCTLGHSAHLSEGHAAEELFYRLNHARQTVDFVKRQAQAFSALDKAALGVWEALELLNGLREYEAALLGAPDATPDMPLLEHALQVGAGRAAAEAAAPMSDMPAGMRALLSSPSPAVSTDWPPSTQQRHHPTHRTHRCPCPPHPHSTQSAEACRAAFPDEDYMHLAGLLAPLGKLLAHAK
jgi:hypothetical protein